ncbi:MAG: hypothetical protein LBU69_00820 [Deltaproteobacteria bacterium]|jgi:hypothetical protein|nr:hypothetical protein [Deltaproteobacteria bacterium]
MPDGQEKKKRVDNTVAHFEDSDGEYVFNGDGIANVFRIVIGFRADNSFLLKQPLVFFSDGARSIHEATKNAFSFTQYKIILDYCHLQRKLKEFFSMAIKGKTISKEHHSAIMKLLWVGDVDGAIPFMANVDPLKVKNMGCLIKLTDYLNRVRDFIIMRCVKSLAYEMVVALWKNSMTCWLPSERKETA